MSLLFGHSAAGTQILLLVTWPGRWHRRHAMKTVFSIPADVFARAERFAKQTHRSRSEVYCTALRDYLERHSPDDVTNAIDRLCGELDPTPDPFVAGASRRLLENSEW